MLGEQYRVPGGSQAWAVHFCSQTALRRPLRAIPEGSRDLLQAGWRGCRLPGPRSSQGPQLGPTERGYHGEGCHGVGCRHRATCMRHGQPGEAVRTWGDSQNYQCSSHISCDRFAHNSWGHLARAREHPGVSVWMQAAHAPGSGACSSAEQLLLWSAGSEDPKQRPAFPGSCLPGHTQAAKSRATHEQTPFLVPYTGMSDRAGTSSGM